MPYASNAAIADEIAALTRGPCAGVSRTVVMGESVDGRPVRALEIGATSSDVGADANDARWSGRVRVGVFGNMHGDEPVGREIAMALARRTCARAREAADGEADERRERALAARLLEEATIFVVPTINPDGFERKTRENARGVDLNRNFPYAGFDMPASASRAGKSDNAAHEVETELVMRWSKTWRLNVAINYHEGALVANYPWDGNADGRAAYSSAPDDETFRYLSQLYADAHPKMHDSVEFRGGITNGAGWYPLWGGMQDWHYVNTGTYDITVEVDDDKWPSEDRLDAIVAEHVAASLKMIERAAFGSVRGYVRDREGNGIPGASVSVGHGLPVTTDRAGFFAKPSAPSNHPVRVIVNPPANFKRFLAVTRTVDVIDPERGAVVDVVIEKTFWFSFSVVFVGAIVALFAIRRTVRRHRRVGTNDESLSNGVDVERAIAHRRSD